MRGAVAAVALLALAPALAPAPAAAEEATAVNPTFRVFATREGLVGHTTANGHVIVPYDHFVALPSGKSLACKGCYNKQVKVCNPANGKCETAPVWDVGPWNTKDDYWNAERELFKNLPRGKPEAQAAYYEGYNGGKDMFGRTVLNPAGIDLADGTFWNGLGMTNNGWVDVTFLFVDDGDATPPTTPVVAEDHLVSGWKAHAHPRWTFAATDPESGVSAYEVDPSWGAPFATTATTYHPTLGTGTWSVKVRAKNGQGLAGAWSASVSAKVDVTPPAAPVATETHSGTEWSSHATPLFSWTTPSDVGGGVGSYVMDLDGASTSTTATSWHPAVSDGTHAFRVRAVDVAGNSGGWSSTLAVKVDTTPPATTAAVASPGPAPDGTPLVNASGSFSLAAADALSGVALTEWRLDAGAWKPYAGPFGVDGLPDGPHALHYRSRDVAGNVEPTRALAFVLDASPPEVALAEPPPDAIVAGEVAVSASASDAAGVAALVLLVDGVVRAALPPSGGSWTWSAGAEAAGDHVLAARAVDAAGNVGVDERWVTTLPTGVAGLGATAARAAALPDDAPVVEVVVACEDGFPAGCRAGVVVGGRFRGVHGGEIVP